MKRELWTISPTLLDRGHSHEVPVEIHPHSNGRLLINMPGWDGAIDGYEEKYRKLADFLVEQDIAAVIRCGNHPIEPFDYEESCRAQIRDLTKTALAKSVEICGSPTPELYYMGFSAGASAMAASAHLFPELQSMLLVAPSQDAGREPMRSALSQFHGSVYIVVGSADFVVGSFPQQVAQWGPPNAPRHFTLIPQCDHQFRGQKNGRILSQAPLWAFKQLDPFPHPDAGIVLYD